MSGFSEIEHASRNGGRVRYSPAPGETQSDPTWAFKSGQCAQTRLARAGMIVAPLADGRGFEVIIRRSFADYLLRWLQDAAIAFE